MARLDSSRHSISARLEALEIGRNSIFKVKAVRGAGRVGISWCTLRRGQAAQNGKKSQNADKDVTQGRQEICERRVHQRLSQQWGQQQQQPQSQWAEHPPVVSE